MAFEWAIIDDGYNRVAFHIMGFSLKKIKNIKCHQLRKLRTILCMTFSQTNSIWLVVWNMNFIFPFS
jgi:hypothetical protein